MLSNWYIKKECNRCEQLRQGMKVESEHAKTLESVGVPKKKIPEAEMKIAGDHIKEDEQYYDKLDVVESPKFKLKMKKAMTAGGSGTGSGLMHTVADGKRVNLKIKKAYPGQISSKDESDEKEIRNLRLKSKLSPSIKDMKELFEKDNVKREWGLDLAGMLASDRDISGTFHKPVIDKENDIIPAAAMDKAMDDFMILPTLQEVHTERTVGIITKTWKTGEDEYKFEGKIKPGDDCDDVWKKVKSGEYDGLSIGGRRIKYSQNCAIPSSIRTTPCVTHKLKLYNVSVCSSPVNPEATLDEFNKVAKGESAEPNCELIQAESTSNIIHEGVKQ